MKQALFNHMRKLGLILTQSELREIELKCKRIIAERTSSNPMLHLLSEHLSDQHSLYLPDETEFVVGFTSSGELTPIDTVIEVTGLTYGEISSSSEIVKVRRSIFSDETLLSEIVAICEDSSKFP